MNIHFVITEDDIREARTFYEHWETSHLVQDRYRRNVLHEHPEVDLEQLWWAIGLGLLTSQQRSDATSPVSQVINSQPYLLDLDRCRANQPCAGFVLRQLKIAGGVRRTNIIADQLERNLDWLEAGGWAEVMAQLGSLEDSPGKERERASAHLLQHWFVGLGPKQSRNVLQVLGLTQHAIPLDSRLIRWMNSYGFPLSTKALADPAAYELVEDGFQALCVRIGVLPCLMDAAIFASYDPTGWWAPETDRGRVQ